MRLDRVQFVDLHPEDGGRVLIGLEVDEDISDTLERTMAAAALPPQVHRLEGSRQLILLGVHDTAGVPPALAWLLGTEGFPKMVTQAAALDSSERTLTALVQKLIDEHP